MMDEEKRTTKDDMSEWSFFSFRLELLREAYDARKISLGVRKKPATNSITIITVHLSD